MTIKNLLPEFVFGIFSKYEPEEVCFIYRKPVSARINGKMFFVSRNGDITKSKDDAVICNKNMICEIFKRACDNSVYAYEDEIKNGFVTIDGGHRIGICGRGVLKDGVITHIKDISALNLRVSHEIKGCAENVVKFISGNNIANTLVISPPGCGKTTMLRDMARIIGKYKKVGIADERREIGGDTFDTGMFTVIMDGVPKSSAIDMMIRSMGIEVVITDEIGSEEDEMAIRRAIYSGVSVIASIHGLNPADVKEKSDSIYSCFDKAVVLSRKYGCGTIEEMVVCL